MVACEDRITKMFQYTGFSLSTGTSRYIFNVLKYQYYTSTKPVIMFFMSDKNVFPQFEKGIKGDNFNVFNRNAFCDIPSESSTYKKNNDA